MEKEDKKKKIIGQIIKAEVERQGLSATQFADKICVSRTAVYNIYGQETMNSGMLAKISEVLHHNFFEELSHRVNMKLGIVPSALVNMNMKLTSFYNAETVEFSKDRESLKMLLK